MDNRVITVIETFPSKRLRDNQCELYKTTGVIETYGHTGPKRFFRVQRLQRINITETVFEE